MPTINSIAFVDSDGSNSELPLEDALATMKNDRNAVLVRFDDRSSASVALHLLQLLPELISSRQEARHQQRIETMIDSLLGLDPFASADALIDIDNAQMRAEFLEHCPVLDSAQVHARAGHSGKNTAQTAASWKRAGKILAVSHKGRDLFPAFQFDADGRPLPLLRDVLEALPPDLTPWQRAFWFASPADELEGALPADLVQAGDRRVLEAAPHAGRMPIG